MGHIFEQSISDIEYKKAEITNLGTGKVKGQRKHDGIYYTPEHITHFIVEQCIGGWLSNQRDLLEEENLPDLSPNVDTFIQKENIKIHQNFWRQYRERLSMVSRRLKLIP